MLLFFLCIFVSNSWDIFIKNEKQEIVSLIKRIMAQKREKRMKHSLPRKPTSKIQYTKCVASIFPLVLKHMNKQNKNTPQKNCILIKL